MAQHSGNVVSPHWEAITHVSICVCAHPVILDIIYSTQAHICTNPHISFTQTQFPVCHYHSPYPLLLLFLSKKDSIQEEALHTRTKLIYPSIIYLSNQSKGSINYFVCVCVDRERDSINKLLYKK